MSWIDENNEHEGYLAYITKDGQAAVGTTYGGLLVALGSDEHLVPWDQLLGWQIRCDCQDEWRDGPLWLAPAGTQEPDEVQTAWGGRSVTVEEAGRNYWRTHHRSSLPSTRIDGDGVPQA